VTRGKSTKKNPSIKPSSTQSLPQQDLTNPPHLQKTITHAALTNSSSETAPASEPSTPSKQTSEATENFQSALPTSPEWPIFNKHDDTALKGLPYFHARKTNIINFEEEPNAIWRHEFGSMEVLAWKENKKHTGAVNLYMIGRLSKSDLMNAHSDFDSDPAYRLKLTLERDTVDSIRSIMDNGPLKDIDVVHSPILGRFADFSAKLKKLQATDAPRLDIDDPFPFVWDGRDSRPGSLLKAYPVDKLCDTDMLAVEMNISSYDFSARSGSRRAGYSLSLRNVYVFPETISNFSSSAHSSPKNLKRQGDSLVSPRRNKKPGQLAVFSDDED